MRQDENGPGWGSYGEVDRDIVAHKDCLERYYTPPATLECSDCGMRLASSDLGFTALKLWSASSRTWLQYTCPRCGARRHLDSVGCEFAPTPHVLDSYRFFGPYYGIEPCMKPLYSFQVGPNGKGHGHAEHKEEAEWRRSNEQAEQRKREEDKKAASGSGCFIATSVYGSTQTPEVLMFQQFRDTVLLNNKFGKILVTVYYFSSPYFAHIVSKSEVLKRLIKPFLKTVLKLIQKFWKDIV